VKTGIGFLMPRFNQNREGLLGKELSPKELLAEIQAMAIDPELKNALLSILVRAI